MVRSKKGAFVMVHNGSGEPLRLGVLSYINCLPLTLGLESRLFGPQELSLTSGHPAQLNRAMAGGQLDVSVVSSAEYLAHREQYQRLVRFSLWCDGAVQSVLLFSPLSREELQSTPCKLAVTPESATSVALLKLLLPNCSLEPYRHLESLGSQLGPKGRYAGALLIGDTALRPPAELAGLRAHDLGGWWKERTGLPMTYAVWVARRDLPAGRLRYAVERLEESLAYGETHPQEVLQTAFERSGLGRERLLSYYRGLRFRTEPSSAEGFVEFGGRLALRRFLEAPIERPMTAH